VSGDKRVNEFLPRIVSVILSLLATVRLCGLQYQLPLNVTIPVDVPPAI